MARAIPVLKKENLAYSREEKEGYWTLIPKLHPETRELIVNFTAEEILELCDGKRSLKEIEEVMMNRYPSVQRAQIEIDVEKTIASFSRLGVIEWMDGDNPFLYRCKAPLGGDFWLAIGQEDDILRIENFIKYFQVLSSAQFDSKEMFRYKSPYVHEKEYEILALRQKLFAYIEEFFLLFHHQEIWGLLSVEIPLHSNSTVAMIKMIITPKEYFRELLRYAQDNFLMLVVRDTTKIRIIELLPEPLDLTMKEVLLSEGYKEEGILQDEFGFGRSGRILSRCYEPSFVEKINKLRLKMKGGDKYVKNLPNTDD